MANKYLNLAGTDKIKDTYDDINNAFTNVEADFYEQSDRMDDHINGLSEKHGTNDIINDSVIVTGTTATDAIDNLKGQLDAAVLAASNANIGVFSMNGTGTNTITATFTNLTYFTGLKIQLTTAGVNTTAATLNINSLGAKNIKVKQIDGTKVSLSGGEMPSIAQLEYDGTDFVLLNSQVASYTSTTTATQQIIPLSSTTLKNRMELTLAGNTEVNFVKNGNFVNGDNWAPTAGTESTSSNVYSLTGDGSAADIFTTQDTPLSVVNAKKVYFRALAKVTNANASSIALKVVGSTAGTETTIKSQATPANGTWYLLDGVLTTPNDFTGVYRINIYQSYADAATANNKVMQIKEVMAIDLTSRYGAGSEPSAADCLLRYANWFDGVKSSDRQIVKSVGKNLFDGDFLRANIDGNGNPTASTANILTKLIKISASTTYVINTSNYTKYFIWYDINKAYLSVTAATYATSPANAAYMRIQINDAQSNINTLNTTLQIERGSTATTYEPYTETTAIVPVELKKISSTIKDIYDANSGKFTKNVEKDLDVSDTQYNSQDISTYTNVDVIKTTAFSLMKTPTTGVDGITLVFDKNGKKLEEVSQANIDLVASVGKYYVHTDKTIWYIVAADTYVDIAAARTGLGTSKLFYQLETPLETKYFPNILNAEPNGTIYTYPFVADYDFYNSGCAITNTSYPIASLEYVNIVNKTDGSMTPVALSTCTVAANGLSFTSTAISAEDLVDFGYTYKDLSTVADVTYTYASNLKGTVDGNTKSIAELEKEIDRLRILAKALEERVTALEP